MTENRGAVNFIDTHTHIDGEEFREDLDLVVQRAREAGAVKLFVPGINAASVESVRAVCERYPGFCYGMVGLHPEEVTSQSLPESLTSHLSTLTSDIIAIGEIGLDFYWSREFEKEQLEVFEEQVKWAIDLRLPLMIHCRKAQNEMVGILRRYEGRMHGGVFHCFTGNEQEARELLSFDGFCLGIGGVLTFRKSNLPQTLASAVPLSRIVLETDAPYMAPVPHRGERNESSFVPCIIDKLAEVYNTTPDEIAFVTTENVKRTFPLAFA